MVIVDAPPGATSSRRNFPGGFDDAQCHAQQDALTHTRAIVVTHEHADHLQGIAESPNLPAFADHLMLTREQRDDTKWLTACKFPENVRASLHPLDFDHYYPLAPGIVLIKAPGHTPGSQIVYLPNGGQLRILADRRRGLGHGASNDTKMSSAPG